MPNMIYTCGGINTCGSIVDDFGTAIITAGKSYLENLAAIDAAKAQQKINAAQAQALVEQAKAVKAQADAEKAAADAEFKKKLPLYIGGGVAALALLYFFTRRR